MRGGPCTATRRPLLAPWARHVDRQPQAVMVPVPGCGAPASVCGVPGVIQPGTTVYDTEVPMYEYPSGTIYQGEGIPTQPIPSDVIGPESRIPGS